MRDLSAEIITGKQADEAFGHLVLRDPEEMRRETEQAFEKIRQLFAEAVANLIRRGKF